MIQESILGTAGARILDQRSGTEAAQLRKLGDAGGAKSWDASAAQNRFLNHFRYTKGERKIKEVFSKT